jgi:hypothetical protein
MNDRRCRYCQQTFRPRLIILNSWCASSPDASGNAATIIVYYARRLSRLQAIENLEAETEHLLRRQMNRLGRRPVAPTQSTHAGRQRDCPKGTERWRVYPIRHQQFRPVEPKIEKLGQAKPLRLTVAVPSGLGFPRECGQAGQERYTLREAEATLRSAFRRDQRDPWENGKHADTAKIL